MKICKKCNLEKPKTEFSKKSKSSDGLQPKCKYCDKIYKYENMERLCSLQKRYREQNRERMSERDRDYRLKNSYRISAVKKIYNSLNKELNAQINRNRSARMRKAEGTHTSKDVREILDSQRGLCANCKAKLFRSGSKKYHVDHIMPLALGGSNWPDNLQCLCPTCNLRKHAKDPFEWAKQNGRLL